MSQTWAHVYCRNWIKVVLLFHIINSNKRNIQLSDVLKISKALGKCVSGEIIHGKSESCTVPQVCHVCVSNTHVSSWLLKQIPATSHSFRSICFCIHSILYHSGCCSLLHHHVYICVLHLEALASVRACLCEKGLQSVLLQYFCKGLAKIFPLLEERWWEVFKGKNGKHLTPIKKKWELSVCQVGLWKPFWWCLRLNQITLKNRWECVKDEVIAWDKVLPVRGGPDWSFQCLCICNACHVMFTEHF